MRWIQRKTPPYDLIPAHLYQGEPKEASPLVFGDLPDLVSPVTNEVMHGRAGMRRHMKEHNLVHAEDYKNEWKEKNRVREEFLRGNSRVHREDIRRDIVEVMKRKGEL